MQHSFELVVADNSCVRLLQLTDTHLFADPKQALLGIVTRDSLQQVIKAIAKQNLAPDLIITSGDISQDKSAASYRAFAAMISALDAPCAWVPGNHDDRATMDAYLTTPPFCSAKQILAGDDWQLVLLNSQVKGENYGKLDSIQLKFLRKCLMAYPDRFALVVLHHPPVLPLGGWLSELILHQAEDLLAEISDFPLATTLLCGHIHQELDVQWFDKRVITTPSTCIQFKSKSSAFKLDILPPGWRWLELYADGNIVTQVERLSPSPFYPDMSAGGY